MNRAFLKHLAQAFPVHRLLDQRDQMCEFVGESLRGGCGIVYQHDSRVPFAVFDYNRTPYQLNVILARFTDANQAVSFLISYLKDKPNKTGLLMRLMAWEMTNGEKYEMDKKPPTD